MTTVLLLGGAGAVSGLVVGLLARRPLRAAVACAALVLAYLALVWTTASTDGSACHDCWEWRGRWAEWHLVLVVAAANAATLFVSALLVSLVLARRSGGRGRA